MEEGKGYEPSSAFSSTGVFSILMPPKKPVKDWKKKKSYLYNKSMRGERRSLKILMMFLGREKEPSDQSRAMSHAQEKSIRKEPEQLLEPAGKIKREKEQHGPQFLHSVKS